jgi:hypothetical protein
MCGGCGWALARAVCNSHPSTADCVPSQHVYMYRVVFLLLALLSAEPQLNRSSSAAEVCGGWMGCTAARVHAGAAVARAALVACMANTSRGGAANGASFHMAAETRSCSSRDEALQLQGPEVTAATARCLSSRSGICSCTRETLQQQGRVLPAGRGRTPVGQCCSWWGSSTARPPAPTMLHAAGKYT